MLPQMRNISERQFDNPVKHKNYYRKAAWQPCETQEILQKGSMTTLWNTRTITERQYDNPVKHKKYYRKAVWQPCETEGSPTNMHVRFQDQWQQFTDDTFKNGWW